MVERGGLDYTIRGIDQFTNTFRKFKAEIASVRKDAKAPQGVGGQRPSKESARRSKDLSIEQAGEKALAREVRATAVEVKKQEIAKKKGIVTSKAVAASKKKEAAAQKLLTQQAKALAASEKKAASDRIKAVKASAAASKAASKKEQDAINQRIRSIQAGVRAEQAAQKQRAAVRKANIADQNEVIKGIQTAGQRLRQQGQLEAKREQTARKRLAANNKLVNSNARLVSSQKRVDDHLIRTNRTGNRLAFTFRRLIGIFATFAAARLGAQAFAGLIKGAVNFTDKIERSSLAIAGLIQNLTVVRNAQGETATGGEAFALSLEEGRRQTALLQRDSLRTVATLEELQFAFQQALGPGLAAGLNVDEIRKFSVQASQAATAIALEQNQLGEEVRNILQGTVQGRTTRLAAVFGASPAEINASIKAAKEAGTLFDFLSQNLGGFDLASQLAAQSFSGLTQRVKDSVLFSGGVAADGLLFELKLQLQDLLNLFIEIPDDPLAAVVPRPQAFAILKTVFDGISGAIAAVRVQLDQLSFNDVLSGAQGLAGIFTSIGTIVGAALRGIVDGVAVVTRVVRAFFSLFSSVDTSGVAEVVRIVTSIAVVLGAVSLATSALGVIAAVVVAPFKLLLSTTRLIFTAATRVAVAMAAIPLPIFALLGAAVTVGVIFRDWVNTIAGAEVKLSTLWTILKDGIFNVATVVAAQFDLIFTQIIVSIRSAFNTVISFMLKGLLEVVDLATTVAAGLSDEAFNRLLGAQDAINGAIAGLRSQSTDLERSVDGKTAALTAAAAQAIQDFDRALADDKTAPTVAENIRAALLAVKESIGGVFDFDFSKLDAATKKLNDASKGGGGSFGGRVQAVTEKQLDQLAANRAKATEVAAQAEQVLADIKSDSVSVAQRAFNTEQAKLTVLEAQLNVERQRSSVTLRNGAKALAVARARSGAEEQLKTLQARRLAAGRELTLEEQRGLEAGQQLEFSMSSQENIILRNAANEAIRTAELEKQKQKLAEQQQILTGSFGEGLAEGLVGFAEKFGTEFQLGVDLAMGSLEALKSAVTKSLVDGFVNVGKTGKIESFFDGLRKIAVDLLQNIATQIIDMLVQIAIQKAILGLATSVASGSPGGASLGAAQRAGALGLNKGGPVRGYNSGGGVGSPVSSAHYGRGEGKPPAGINRKDTVAAWLTPNEHVMPVHSVKAYGMDLFEAFRKGAIDPFQARQLLKSRQYGLVQAKATKGPRGFNRGGSVGGSTIGGSTDYTDNRSGTLVAAIPINEQELDRMTNNDQFHDAMLDWVRSNPDDIDSILQAGRKNT